MDFKRAAAKYNKKFNKTVNVYDVHNVLAAYVFN